MKRYITSSVPGYGLAFLAGLFISDAASRNWTYALGQLPLRAGLMLAILLVWAAIRTRRAKARRDQSGR